MTLSRFGVAYDKPAPRVGELSGSYAKSLAAWTGEDISRVQDVYAERAKSVGEDFAADAFLWPYEVGVKFHWLNKDWL